MRLTEPTGWLGSPSRRFAPYPSLGLGFVGADPKFVGDRLLPGQGLHTNEGIQSKNGRVKVFLQSDGNFVLYGDGKPLWWTGVRPGTGYAVMQGDGNFVLYKGQEHVWDAGTAGNGGAILVAQDDGNLVLYFKGRALWSSETNGFRYRGGPSGPNIFQQITQTATAPVRVATEEVLKAATGKDITVESVSVSAHDIITAAQMAISFVPGVGAGVNAAIAAGAALAAGENITDAMADAAKNALPGGPVAAQAFDTARSMIKAAANGENIGDVALAAAREAIPGDLAKRAFDTGLAIAHGQNVQQALVGGATSLVGKAVAALAPSALPPELTDVAKSLPPETTRIATALFNNPQLQSLAASEAAKLLHSDPATVTKAAAAVSTAKAHPARRALVQIPPRPAATPATARRAPPVIPHRGPPAPPTSATPKPAIPPAIAHHAYGPYPKTGALSAPPPRHGGGHGGGHRGGGFHPSAFRGARGGPGWWWGVPWSPEVVVETTCRTWGNPITIPPEMQRAAQVALNVSGGRPTTVRGPDNVLYLFSYENGVMTARACAA